MDYFFLLKCYLEQFKQFARSWVLSEQTYKVQLLPDDILVEILSRLPAEKVLEYRRVCKHWNTLTSTPHFAHKHLRNTSPSIHISYRNVFSDEEQCVYLFDEWEETRQTKNKIKKLGPKKSIYPLPVPYDLFNTIRYNHCGLLVFSLGNPLMFPYNSKKSTCEYSQILYNPVTRQKLVLNSQYGLMCAYYYHPLTEEYRVLWYQRSNFDSGSGYHILNLGSPISQLSWRKIANFNYLPNGERSDVHSVVLKNTIIHWITADFSDKIEQPWCNDSILIFDIYNETFSTMPHPGDKCVISQNRHKSMHLLEIKCGFENESLLCLCDCSENYLIDLWVLEDYEKRIWVRRHRIVLDIYISYPLARREVVPFGLLNGKLLISVGEFGVFAYHFRTSILERIIEVVNGRIGYKYMDHIITHVGLFHKSLVSFTSFKGMHFNMEP